MILKQYSLSSKLKILSLITFLSLLSSCFKSPALIGGEGLEKPKGRCAANQDCPPGFRCKDTFCEDIYYPARRVGP